MAIKHSRDVASSEITPKHLYLNRREFLRATGVGAAGLWAGIGAAGIAAAEKLAISTIPMTDHIPRDTGRATLGCITPGRRATRGSRSA